MSVLSELFCRKSDIPPEATNAQSAYNDAIVKDEAPIIMRQNDGWAILFKKWHIDKAVQLYRTRRDAQPLSDNAIMADLAAALIVAACLVSLLGLILSGCSSRPPSPPSPTAAEIVRAEQEAADETAWAKAQKENTIEGYSVYLDEFGDRGTHRDKARDRRIDLEMTEAEGHFTVVDAELTTDPQRMVTSMEVVDSALRTQGSTKEPIEGTVFLIVKVGFPGHIFPKNRFVVRVGTDNLRFVDSNNQEYRPYFQNLFSGGLWSTTDYSTKAVYPEQTVKALFVVSEEQSGSLLRIRYRSTIVPFSPRVIRRTAPR